MYIGGPKPAKPLNSPKSRTLQNPKTFKRTPKPNKACPKP